MSDLLRDVWNREGFFSSWLSSRSEEDVIMQ